MKSEDEIRRAAGHLRQAAKVAIKLSPGRVAGAMLSLADVLAWVLDEPNRFEEDVMRPCEAVDAEDALKGRRPN